ncbi:MAG: transcription termination factor Rho [Sphaerochaetaceae bacterium]
MSDTLFDDSQMPQVQEPQGTKRPQVPAERKAIVRRVHKPRMVVAKQTAAESLPPASPAPEPKVTKIPLREDHDDEPKSPAAEEYVVAVDREREAERESVNEGVKPEEQAIQREAEQENERRTERENAPEPMTHVQERGDGMNRRMNNNYRGRNNRNRQFQKNNKPNNPNNPNRNNQRHQEDYQQDINIEEHPEAAVLSVNDYSSLPIETLRKIGVEKGIDSEIILDLRKQEILSEILKRHSAKGGVIVGSGTLEILPDGFGFLRSANNSYLSGPEDIYISPAQVKSLSLKTGDVVYGQVRTPRDGERFFAILRILTINGDDPIKAKTRASFETLTPLFPNQRINLETPEEDISMRIINMFCPIGKGQRSLIIAPPRTGKTVLMQKIANSISTNYPDVVLMVLLVDERPEEVTDMRRHVKGEVIASTFDEQASRHVQVAEMVIEKAKRLVEHKKDVVILLDSITRLARAYNQTVPASGKILSGGVDSNALHKPKRFFGAARNIEEGGSLTIIATGLIETGSRMDEVIFEEFKGTGNNEIILDRKLADRRIFPAINIKKSGTRRDDLLLPADEAARIWLCRNAVGDMDEQDLTPFLIDKIKKTKDNEAFLRSINTDVQTSTPAY